MCVETKSQHTYTIVLTTEIESRFFAKDDLVPFHCSPVSSCAAPLQTEASMGSTRKGRRDPKYFSARRLLKIREDTGAHSEGDICAWWWPMKQLAVRVHFLRCVGLLNVGLSRAS
ncbi:hypothetical protein TNCV_1517551 [Trichonephila clavipes]|nr:hypothetical protein TNCV_1517551 [Trichonephila clavipes]